MTDARIVATNPVDSSVVPVACNESGELLLEEPTLASDDYVAKTGDNMTGNLTLNTDKITLDATDGSVTFADGNYEIIRSGGVNQFGRINMKVGPEPTVSAFSVANVTGYGLKARWYGDGSLSIGGNVYGNGAATDDPNIKLNAGGSAAFTGDVVVGSRSKQWMLVEQGGLCHMVEQVRATTADLVAPTTEYPPLRDVIAELNAVEQALGEVMDKLRMTPPAGFPVWDGSDEN